MSDGDEMGTGPRAAEDRQYETKVVQAIRGTESRAEAKWRKEGWELVSQSPGKVRTEMTFRRTKPKTFGTYLARAYTAFRGLTPKTQGIVGALVGGLLLVLIAGGIGAATLGGDDSPDPTAAPTTSATVTDEDAAAPSSEDAAAPTPESAAPSEQDEESGAEPADDEGAPEDEQPEPEPYTYTGPAYETIAVDEDVVGGDLDQHWVLVDSLDPSVADFEAQVKLIVADVAHTEGTTDLSVSVVTDPEIAAYRSTVTGPDFVAENGQDYVDQVVRPKVQSGFLAWYTGGFDPDNGLSSSDTAYEVVWLPASDSPDFENWKPTTGAS